MNDYQYRSEPNSTDQNRIEGINVDQYRSKPKKQNNANQYI